MQNANGANLDITTNRAADSRLDGLRCSSARGGRPLLLLVVMTRQDFRERVFNRLERALLFLLRLCDGWLLCTNVSSCVRCGRAFGGRSGSCVGGVGGCDRRESRVRCTGSLRVAVKDLGGAVREVGGVCVRACQLDWRQSKSQRAHHRWTECNSRPRPCSSLYRCS